MTAMSFSLSATVLLRDFTPGNHTFGKLKAILEEAQIEVVAGEQSFLTDLAQPATEHHPSLIIQALDQRALRNTQPLAAFPTTLPPNIPVIVTAENFEAEEIRRLLDLGATDFITLPFTAASVLPRVWRLLSHSKSAAASRFTLQDRMAIGRLGLIGESSVFLQTIKKLRMLARCDITVLIGGETGTGKELVARAIHYLSPRSDRPFVPLDCGAIPPELAESELFGHERGAFTGAVTKNPGLIAAADQGTLFLDEVDALNLSVQAKILRFLQETEYRSLGSSEIKKADVRLISATNGDLVERVHRNEFRKDLYYRLNVVQLNLPSLRQRREDVILLARHFAAKHAARFHQPQREFSADAIQKLLTHHWPGNIRELENVVGAAVALCDGPLICASDLLFADDQTASPASFREAKAQVITEFEREYILRLLTCCDGNVSHAAKAAGKNRRAFWELIRKHRIDARVLRSDPGQELPRKRNARARGFATG
jgi:two-component system, NtrC family, response regulator GlrR